VAECQSTPPFVSSSRSRSHVPGGRYLSTQAYPQPRNKLPRAAAKRSSGSRVRSVPRLFCRACRASFEILLRARVLLRDHRGAKFVHEWRRQPTSPTAKAAAAAAAYAATSIKSAIAATAATTASTGAALA